VLAALSKWKAALSKWKEAGLYERVTKITTDKAEVIPQMKNTTAIIFLGHGFLQLLPIVQCMHT
jgi:hypothetical protein